MSRQAENRSIRQKPILSFGISSILGTTESNHKDNVSDTEKHEQQENMLTLTTPRGSVIHTDQEVHGREAVVSLHGSARVNKVSIDSGAEASLSAQDYEESPACSEERSSRTMATYPLMPCIASHTLMIKPLERYPPKGLMSEYRRVGHPYSNRTPAKRKKPRTTFSRDQIAELEARFMGQKYLASTERLRLAKHLQLTDAQVKTWFQNRRTKWRRQTAEEREAERNAATKYIIKMQESAVAAAAFWTPLLNLNCRGDTFGSSS